MTEKLHEYVICEKCGAECPKNATKCIKCNNPLSKDYYRGLWLKNAIITLALFLLPCFILFYIINFEISTHFESQVMKQLQYSIDVNGRTIGAFFEERRADLLSISKLDIEGIRDIMTKRILLQRFAREKPWFDFIAVADPDGTILFSTNHIQTNVKNEPYFENALKGSFENSGIFYSAILDTNAMVLASPLLNRYDRVVGVIFSSICLRTFYARILDLRIGETSEVFLVDEQGIFLSPSRLGGQVLKEKGHFHKDTNPHTGNGGVIVHRDYRGEKVICAYKRFEELSGYLVSEIDMNEALAPVTILKRIMFIIFLLFACFVVASSFIFSRRVTNVVKKLTGTLKTALDDISHKKNMINNINRELRRRLADCETLSHKIRVSEEYIKNIINSISSGFIAIDQNLSITYCNNFVRDYAATNDGVINKDLYEAFPMLQQNDVQQNIRKIFCETRSFRLRRVPVIKGKTDLILSIAGFPMHDQDIVTGAILVLNNVTEQELLHAQMADYEKLSALSQLALGAAHEINNPLQGITSYIELLLEEEHDVEKKRQTKEVLDNAYRISETVRGLLNFARPTPPKFTKISINTLITESLSFLQHQPLFRKIVADKALAENVPQITADANQMRQVLLNIFINAAQAMPQGGSLQVTTMKVKFEETVEVTVRDSGVGIPQEYVKKVFDPFFTTKKGEGTGLGLSISYSYVKNHDGTITITSEVNKGTTVTIRLPIRQTRSSSQEVME